MPKRSVSAPGRASEPAIGGRESASDSTSWLALSGGSDGLDSYRALAVQLPDLLAGDGRAFIELGFGQATAAAGLFETGGLQAVDCRSDLAGIPRCLVLGQQKRVGNPLATD